MISRFIASLGATTVAVAALSGCSDNKSSTSSLDTAVAGGAVGQAKVSVNHVDQAGLGPIVCDVSDNSAEITIKRDGHNMAHAVVAWKQGNAPELRSALLLGIQGTRLQIPQLGYGDTPSAGSGPDSTVKKYANRRFVIWAEGWNSTDQHNPFEIDVTCP